MTDITHFCRICLKIPSSGQLTPLFMAANGFLPASIVSNLANIVILEDDSLPQQLCNPCWNRVHDTQLLIKEILESEEWLRNQIFNSFVVKSEVVDNEPELIFAQEFEENDIKEEPMDFIAEKSSENVKTPTSTDPRCCMCPFLCNTTEELELHVRQSHPDRKNKTIEQNPTNFNCPYCHKSYKNRNSYTDHLRKPYVPRKHQCTQCGKTFAYVSELKQHARWHLIPKKELTTTCELCGKTFRLREHLNRHMKRHRPMYQCDICEKFYAEKKHLVFHIKTHLGVRDCLCPVCGKGFVRSDFLKKHMQIHTGERPYKCDVCGKTYKHHSHLKRHKYMHEGVKPFKCGYCERTFCQRSNMQVHERVHTGDMPFECQLCGMKFKFHTLWKTHERQHREEGIEVEGE